MFTKNAKIYIIIGILLVLFFGWYSCSGEATAPENFSMSRPRLDFYLLNHQIYLKLYIYSIINDLPNKKEWLEKLLETQDNIADQICLLWNCKGKNISKYDVGELLKSLVISVANFASYFREDDLERNRVDYINKIRRTSITRLYNDIDRISTLLSKLTGKDYIQFQKLFKNYYKSTLAMIVSWKHQLFEEDSFHTEESNSNLLEILYYLNGGN